MQNIPLLKEIQLAEPVLLIAIFLSVIFLKDVPPEMPTPVVALMAPF